MKGLQRAYSLLTVKSVDEEQHIITGIATTPTPDRLGDVVEPKGAEFKLPIPLLWQHDSRQPVGEMFAAEVTDEGIAVKARFAKSADFTGKLAERLDEAWQSVKGGLVRGLSIGFRSVEEAFNKDTFSFHFLKWEWMELSAVTIPANADATIQTVRSYDRGTRTASGRKSLPIVKVAGVTAAKPNRAVEAQMTLEEQLKAMEAKRAASVARMADIMTKSADAGETLDDAMAEEYDNLEAEVESIDKHITRLRKAIEMQVSKAVPITGVDSDERGSQRRAAPQITVRDNLPQGIEFARYAMCLVVAKGDEHKALQIAKARYPDQPRIARVLEARAAGIDVTKTAIAGGSTTHTTWAGPLVQVDTGFIGDFVDYLRPATIIGKFGTNGIPSLVRVPFNVSVPNQSSGGTGYWVGEGQPKPVTSFAFGRTTIPYTKVANIAVITEELARFSTPSAEMLVRNSLAAALIQQLDVDFVSPTKAISAGISPASITNGCTPNVASAYTAAAFRKDVIVMMAKFTALNMSLSSGVFIMGTKLALNLSNMYNSLGQQEFPGLSLRGGTLNNMPVIVSDNVPDVNQGSPTIARPILILMDAGEVWLADDGGISIDISREASLQMDTAPTNTPTGLGASPNAPTATTMVSMFQTDSIAIRAEREISWLKRRSGAAQYMTNCSYAPS